MSEPIHLTYIFDPLCGWCYGAGPSVEKLMAAEGIAVEIVPSGLFSAAGAFPMNAGFAAHAWDADQRIARLTGQEFSAEYRKNVLESGKGMVDSSAATLALTAVKLTAPERELETLEAIQRARYVDGRDNGKAEVIAEILTELGLNDAARRFADRDDDLLAANNARIEIAQRQMQQFGARGVPTLIATIGDEAGIVGSGALYGQVGQLISSLRAHNHRPASG